MCHPKNPRAVAKIKSHRTNRTFNRQGRVEWLLEQGAPLQTEVGMASRLFTYNDGAKLLQKRLKQRDVKQVGEVKNNF
jgi:hypothetical protein